MKTSVTWSRTRGEVNKPPDFTPFIVEARGHSLPPVDPTIPTPKIGPEPHPEAVVLSSDPFDFPPLPEAELLGPANSDANGAASPRHSTRRLAVNAAAGGAANLVKIAIQVVMLPLMAHLLGPTEFGLFALAIPTVAFLTTLSDGGLSASLARESETSTVVWSTAFWLLLGVGIALAVIVSGWGVVLSMLAHEPGVTALMSFLSLSFVLVTASVLPSARLTRQGRLVVFAGADLSSAIVGALVAVTLAASGWGAKSLAAQYLTTVLIRAVILNAVAFVKPTFVFELSSLRYHLSTGSSLLGGRLSDFAGRLMENLFYGRTFGAAALGLYAFANQVPRFVCEAASGPIWGALYAHALSEDESRLTALHRKLVHLLASVVFPAAFLLSATAPEIFRFILGPKWDAASTLLRILIPFYALHVTAAQSGAVLLARGRGWLLFWLTMILAVGRVAAVCAGPWIGQVGVAYGIGLAEVIYAALMFGAPTWKSSSSPMPMLRGLAAPILSGAVAGLVGYWLAHVHPPSSLWIAFSISIGGFAYIVLMFLLQGRTLLSDLDAIRQMLVRARGS
jgi:O-antigen/teichoic acid export membrane protein